MNEFGEKIQPSSPSKRSFLYSPTRRINEGLEDLDEFWTIDTQPEQNTSPNMPSPVLRKTSGEKRESLTPRLAKKTNPPTTEQPLLSSETKNRKEKSPRGKTCVKSQQQTSRANEEVEETKNNFPEEIDELILSKGKVLHLDASEVPQRIVSLKGIGKVTLNGKVIRIQSKRQANIGIPIGQKTVIENVSTTNDLHVLLIRFT